jgi:hypothetical protein
MAVPVGRGLLPVALLVLAGVALSACAGADRTTATDDQPVINTAPRTASRASSLVVIGYASPRNRALVEGLPATSK